jgi:hypothetical protein
MKGWQSFGISYWVLRVFNTKMQVDLHRQVLNICFYFTQHIEVNGYDAISLKCAYTHQKLKQQGDTMIHVP